MAAIGKALPTTLLVLLLAAIAVDLYTSGGRGRPLLSLLPPATKQDPQATDATNQAAQSAITGTQVRSGQLPVAKIEPSFDCAAARTPVERLICRDRDLASLEKRMAEAYLRLRSRSGMRAEQASWFDAYSKACNAAPSEAEMKECASTFLKHRLTRLDSFFQLRLTDGILIALPNYSLDTEATTTLGPSTFRDMAGGDLASYRITYLPDRENSAMEIKVVLNATPLATARLEAEQALRTALRLTNEQLCKMDVSVQVFRLVDEAHSGQNLGLSFCSNAVLLR